MGIKEMIAKFRRKNEVYSELDVQDKAQYKVEQRKLSANERELNKIIEKRRQEAIKNQLDKIHKQERKEYWHSDNISQKNLFVERQKALREKNMFVNNPNVIKQRRLY